jgi:UDP-glucose 4-epimerase
MGKIFITGAAGFIGSNLVDRLLAGGKCIVGWDNFSTGQLEFLASASTNPEFKLIEGDSLTAKGCIICRIARAFAACFDCNFS